MNAETKRQITDLELNLKWCEREQEYLNERQAWLNNIREEIQKELNALTEKDNGA